MSKIGEKIFINFKNGLGKAMVPRGWRTAITRPYIIDRAYKVGFKDGLYEVEVVAENPAQTVCFVKPLRRVETLGGIGIIKVSKVISGLNTVEVTLTVVLESSTDKGIWSGYSAERLILMLKEAKHIPVLEGEEYLEALQHIFPEKYAELIEAHQASSGS